MKFKLLFLALSVMLLPSGALAQDLPKERYTILPALEINLQRGLAYYIGESGQAAMRIEDCSDDTTHCIRSICKSMNGYIPPRPDCVAGSQLTMIWPRQCARHAEIGDQIEQNGVKATMIGYYDRIVHHTGLRSRRYVWSVEGQTDIALIAHKGHLTGVVLDTSETNQIAARFSKNPVFDAKDAGDDAYPNLIVTWPLPNSIGGACAK
ncbi:hypothetical protein [Erythrobacter crassostreae]|uniref:Uncharacterized protein n=1 Tax=Erythrobacter crassostreae TaxID=2828328 RepID=A0A9X1F1E3_9SPHN|nr:hypothetical protein [Erythrobacter crassostrea]MBV7258541.1 hypothetical protein [Erythrobacter crassostrea]